MINHQQSTSIKTGKKKSANVVVSTESSNSDNIRNASRNTNTKDIKKVFVLVDSMVKHVQEWDIIRE